MTFANCTATAIVLDLLFLYEKFSLCSAFVRGPIYRFKFNSHIVRIKLYLLSPYLDFSYSLEHKLYSVWLRRTAVGKKNYFVIEEWRIYFLKTWIDISNVTKCELWRNRFIRYFEYYFFFLFLLQNGIIFIRIWKSFAISVNSILSSICFYIRLSFECECECECKQNEHFKLNWWASSEFDFYKIYSLVKVPASYQLVVIKQSSIYSNNKNS